MTPFIPVRTFNRGTDVIAEIRSDVRTLYVHRVQGKLYQWDRPGLPVRNQQLAEVAEGMLNPEPPRERKTYPERQCARPGCRVRFEPSGPKSYLCKDCRVATRGRPPGRRKVAA